MTEWTPKARDYLEGYLWQVVVAFLFCVFAGMMSVVTELLIKNAARRAIVYICQCATIGVAIFLSWHLFC